MLVILCVMFTYGELNHVVRNVLFQTRCEQISMG
jgi:hypothetical protein